MGRAQEHDGLALVDAADNGIRAFAHERKVLLHAALDLVGVCTAEHPELVHGGNVNMENVGKTAHLQRLILQNGAQQLVDGDRAVLLAPRC